MPTCKFEYTKLNCFQEQNQMGQQMYPGMEGSVTPGPGAGRGVPPVVPFRGRGMPRGRGGRGRGRGGIYAGGADGGTFNYFPYVG